jgi:hypothetical protein
LKIARKSDFRAIFLWVMARSPPQR